MKQTLNRARRLLLILPLSITLMLTENITAQSCAVPLPLTINDCANYYVNDTTVWFSFNSGAATSHCSFTFSNPNLIAQVELYSGACNSLNLVTEGFADNGSFILYAPISSVTSYLVKVIRNGASADSLNICAFTFAATVPCPPCPDSLCQLVCNPDLESNTGPTSFVPLILCLQLCVATGISQIQQRHLHHHFRLLLPDQRITSWRTHPQAI